MFTRKIFEATSLSLPPDQGFIETNPMDIESLSRNTQFSFLFERHLHEDKIRDYKDLDFTDDSSVIIEYFGHNSITPSSLISYSVFSGDYNSSVKEIIDAIQERAKFLLEKESVKVDIVFGSCVRKELLAKHIQDNFFRRAPARV